MKHTHFHRRPDTAIPLVTQAFIDSASLYEIVLVLNRAEPRKSYRLEWDQALEVTAALIRTDHLALPPSPQSEGSASGPYGIMIERLRDAVTPLTLTDNITVSALQSTKQWAHRRIDECRATVAEFTGADGIDPNQDACLWLESHIQNEWVEHATRRGHLFDDKFALSISRILDRPSSELERARRVSSDIPYLRSLSKSIPDTDDFRIIRDCFLVSTILRGGYYDNIARISNRQILSHPLRRPKKRLTYEPIKIHLSNFEKYLSNIVLAASFSESNIDNRILLWTENVIALRAARGRINFQERIADSHAIDDAVHEARRFGLRAHYRLLEKALDVGIFLGCNMLTSYYLSPFYMPIASAVMYGINQYGINQPIGQTIASAMTVTNNSLNKLSQLGPGRIGDFSV